MTSIFRVAAIQFELRWEKSFATFATHFEDVVRRSAEGGAELATLPELVTTGLLGAHPLASDLGKKDMSGAYREFLTTLSEPFAALVGKMARKYGIALVGGSHFRMGAPGVFHNTAYFADKAGRFVLQDKLHLTPPEVAMGTTPGENVIAFRVGPATVAIQICADIEFPEVTRALAVQGVNVVVCPSLTWNRRGANRVRTCGLARAIENQIFVVAAPLIGTSGLPSDGAMHCTGRALIGCPVDRFFGRNDGVLAEADTEGETIVFADLDFDLLEASRARPEPPGLGNIRPSLYSKLDESIEFV